MRDDISTEAPERGQALILAILAMTVVFAIGALVVDLGLWVSERRGAQTDADFAVLAGAWELLDPGATPGDAMAAATSSWQSNDEHDAQANASLAFPSAANGCVAADVNSKSASLFSGIFGAIAPEIGAHAEACAGATDAPPGIVPFELDNKDLACFDSNEVPRFGVLCPLDFGSPGNPNPREILDLIAAEPYCSNNAPGGSEVSVIGSGATGTCLRTGSTCSGSQWHDCVFLRNVNTNSVINEVKNRIAIPNCDTNIVDGIDSLAESVDLVFPASNRYQAKDCDSPRLANVIVLADPDPSPGNSYPIEAFAGFYIAGCREDVPLAPVQYSDLDRDCDAAGGPPHNVVYGEFVNLIIENSAVGKARASTTLFSISLEE